MALTPTYPNPNQTLAAGGLEGATDEVITPAYWNRLAQMVYAMGGLGGFIGCRANGVASQSISTNVFNVVALPGESFDSSPDGAMHDNVTNNSRITIKTPGVYHIGWFAGFATNPNGYRQWGIRWNGSIMIALDTRSASPTGAITHSVASLPFQFSANDYIELLVAQGSGGALDLESQVLWAVKA